MVMRTYRGLSDPQIEFLEQAFENTARARIVTTKAIRLGPGRYHVEDTKDRFRCYDAYLDKGERTFVLTGHLMDVNYASIVLGQGLLKISGKQGLDVVTESITMASPKAKARANASG